LCGGTPHHPAQSSAGADAKQRSAAQYTADNEQRLDQRSQIRHVLHKLLDAGLEPHPPSRADLETEVRKVPRKSFSMAIAFDCRSLRWVSSMRSF
jgi:hypothetical protein